MEDTVLPEYGLGSGYGSDVPCPEQFSKAGLRRDSTFLVDSSVAAMPEACFSTSMRSSWEVIRGYLFASRQTLRFAL